MQRFLAGIISIFLFSLAQNVLAKQVVGWVETALVMPGGLEYMAKLDSGAKTSSLHCKPCHTYSQDDREWVRLEMTDRHGKTVTLNKEILRWVIIRRPNCAKQRRPVIKLDICLAGVYKQTEVNLINRDGQDYALLLGRQFLQEDFLIDTGTQQTSRPDCSAGQDN